MLATDREHTFHRFDAPNISSRVDDVLKLAESQDNVGCAHSEHLLHSMASSDHTPLLHRLSLGQSGFVPAYQAADEKLPPETRSARLPHSIPAADLARYTAAVDKKFGPRILEALSAHQEVMKACLQAHSESRRPLDPA